MVGIVRFLHITRQAALGPTPQLALVALGVLSLLVAALFIVRQRGVKRLMAYSSIEHMGVMALGFGFGGVFGVAGALYHMLNHALNKSLMFFGAGVPILDSAASGLPALSPSPARRRSAFSSASSPSFAAD
jgi:hydrogenase-4 component F